MAMYPCRINSFQEVVDLYNSITPVDVRRSTSQYLAEDVRPTNCRDRQFERVIKISSTKYALTDYQGIFLPWAYDMDCMNRGQWLKYAEAMSPILWERKRSGVELIHIRNGSSSGQYISCFNGTYNFLSRHLPWTIGFGISEGKQFISTRNSTSHHYLPKRAYLPKEARKAVLKAYDNNPHYNHVDKSKWWADTANKTITFERMRNSDFHLVSKKHKMKKKVIDIAAKKKLRSAIESFWEYAAPLTHMLVTGETRVDVSARSDVGKEFADWYQTKLNKPSYFNAHSIQHSPADPRFADKTHRDLIKGIMSSPHDDKSYYLMLLFTRFVHESEGSKELRPHYNQWVNHIFYLYKTIEV